MKEKYLLNQINFSVNKGSKLAITGETGSGKSTLMQLVLGLFVPQDGDILFRNKSIFQNLKNWRNEIGYIPQQVYLLDSTIEKNITLNFFDEKIDKAKMEKAIFLSGLSKKITDLPNGLETRTGSDGLKLSGGEKQRIVIARAIYREPNILIMDEFTSSLDQDTENRILLNLSEFFKDKTIIVISHRSNTIKNCDIILNIENGKLIEIKK
jgi:ABC-type multidrug transport system fused ATPase/permease subunit